MKIDFKDITSKLGFKEYTESFTGTVYYQGIFITGHFEELYDYGTGLVMMRVKEYNLKDKIDTHKISISTVDDGVWSAYGNHLLGKDKLYRLQSEITQKWGHVLPTAKELNNLLQNYGLFGIYTG